MSTSVGLNALYIKVATFVRAFSFLNLGRFKRGDCKFDGRWSPRYDIWPSSKRGSNTSILWQDLRLFASKNSVSHVDRYVFQCGGGGDDVNDWLVTVEYYSKHWRARRCMNADLVSRETLPVRVDIVSPDRFPPSNESSFLQNIVKYRCIACLLFGVYFCVHGKCAVSHAKCKWKHHNKSAKGMWFKCVLHTFK